MGNLSVKYQNSEERRLENLRNTDGYKADATEAFGKIVEDHEILDRKFRKDSVLGNMNAKAVFASAWMIIVSMVVVVLVIVGIAVFGKTRIPDLSSKSKASAFHWARRRDRFLAIAGLAFGLSSLMAVVIQYLILKNDMVMTEKYVKYRLSSALWKHLGAPEVTTHYTVKSSKREGSTVLKRTSPNPDDAKARLQMIRKILNLSSSVDPKHPKMAQIQGWIVDILNVQTLDRQTQVAQSRIQFMYRLLIPAVVLLVALILPLTFMTTEETHADRILGWIQLRNLHKDFTTESDAKNKPDEREVHSWEEAAPWVRAATAKLIAKEDASRPLSVMLFKGLAVAAAILGAIVVGIMVYMYRKMRVVYKKMPKRLHKATEAWRHLIHTVADLDASGSNPDSVLMPGSATSREAVSSASGTHTSHTSYYSRPTHRGTTSTHSAGTTVV